MFESLLQKIARAFDEAGVPYMVSGGQAVLLYGEPFVERFDDLARAT